MKIREVQHIVQINDRSCVAACLAMITGRSSKEVFDEFHDSYINGKTRLCDYLEKHSIPFELKTIRDHVRPGTVYLLSVPSLNIRGGMHQVVLDTRGDICVVYDPAKGKEDKFYYVYDNPKFTNQVSLRGFRIDVELVGFRDKEVDL
jgi:hypothetical protein